MYVNSCHVPVHHCVLLELNNLIYYALTVIFYNSSKHQVAGMTVTLGLHCAIFAARESERLLWELSFRLSG